MPAAEFQVVIFGATSFVGQIFTHYLFGRHGAGRQFKWAIAGRSEDKLKAVRAELGDGAAKLPMIIADAADENALKAMSARTAVVCSTVGPYALYGSPLVKVCAEGGTDYCDLTGEVQWIARMIEAHEASAKRSGARIVHCSGFDSIPSDLGVHYLQQQSQQCHGEPCKRVKLRVKALRGGFSGGTVASLINVVKEVTRDPALRKVLANPYAICPDKGADGIRQPNVSFVEYDPDAESWVAPFVMGAINTRVVLRSNALSGHPYGKDFRYDEAIMTGRGIKGRMAAAGMASGLGGFIAAAAFPPTRMFLEKFVVPKPGEGPTPEQQEKGFYDIRFFGRTEDGQLVRAKVTGDRDPGYGSTAKILGEAAACLAMDVPKNEKPGGFWTPATILGEKLIKRLTAHSGLTFEPVD